MSFAPEHAGFALVGYVVGMAVQHVTTRRLSKLRCDIARLEGERQGFEQARRIVAEQLPAYIGYLDEREAFHKSRSAEGKEA